ncbi:MAG: PEP-CTERM sorting domain-containing protein [Terriglobales bacterium]
MKKAAMFLAVVMLVLLMGSVAARADSVFIAITPTGNPNEWAVNVQNIPIGTVVGGFDLDLYLPGVIGLDSLTFGTAYLGDPALWEGIGNFWLNWSTSTLTVQFVSLLDVSALAGMQSATGFTLFTFSYPQLFGAQNPPQLVRLELSDGFGNPITGAPVPEPATIVLLAPALAGFALRLRRMRRC